MGMDLAEQGINRITGNQSETTHYLEITTNKAQKILLPKKTTSELETLPVKKEKVNAPQKQITNSQVTFISRIGNVLGSLAKTGTDKGMELIAGLIP